MDKAKATLAAMGFEAAAVENALHLTAGNVEQAANYLLTTPAAGSSENHTTTPASAATVEAQQHQQAVVIQGTMSQYSVPDGRSACTCMALYAAATILGRCTSSFKKEGETRISGEGSEEATDDGIITPAFLDDMVLQGSHIYRDQLQSSASSDVEHTSAEEALQKCRAFAKLQLLPGGIRQGILSHDYNHPMGLQALLSDCQQNNRWTCVVITKPPETVLVVLPPLQNTHPQYLWIDSHPRPGCYEQAGCLRHSTLSSLVQATAATMFPVTDLGPDVPEFMATMYNSFDLYPLQWGKE